MASCASNHPGGLRSEQVSHSYDRSTNPSAPQQIGGVTCTYREPQRERHTWQQRAKTNKQTQTWRTHSRQRITMHNASVSASSPTVIYSCPVIRGCLWKKKKKKSICLPRCSFLITSGILPPGNHSASSLRSAGHSELFAALMDRDSFVLLREIYFFIQFGQKSPGLCGRLHFASIGNACSGCKWWALWQSG